MKKTILVLIILIIYYSSQAEVRFDRGITQQTFIPKGQWITGCNISFTQHSNDNYKFIVIEGWNGEGYNFNVSPMVAYAFKDNLAAGGRFKYNRSLLKIDDLSLNLGDDLSFDIHDVYSLSHGYYATGIFRSYISLGDSKRFGLFNEVQLVFGGSQSKYVSGKGESLTGTYENSFNFQIGMSPGLTAFINDYVAAEVSIGVLGFDIKKVNQKTDQVYSGSRQTSSANFKINLFALSLGLAFYL